MPAADTRCDRFLDLYPSLRGLEGDLLHALASHGRVQQVAAGVVLFDRGSPCDGLPLVASGSIRVIRRTPVGREFVLYRLTPGELCVLTTAALLGDCAYDATGVVEADLDILIVPKPLFLRLVDRHAPFRKAAFSVFAARLSLLMLLVEQVAISRLDQRVARLLVQRGPTVKTTHQAVADELATAREVVSRILESFEGEGLVRLQRGQVEVLDADRLDRIAQVRSTPSTNAAAHPS